jgi:putative nucleotidyltransferase with HDIG domain
MGHRPGEHSEAFTAGLLHDIGRLAMATQDPDRYSIVVAMARSGIDTITAERKVFGLGHVEWGGAVAREWQFPEDVTLAITDHHQGVAGRLSVAVSVARRAAASLGIGDGVAGPEPPPGNAKAADDDIIENADAVLRDLHSYVHALRAVAKDYCPVNRGSRFSTNALGPSLASSVDWAMNMAIWAKSRCSSNGRFAER